MMKEKEQKTDQEKEKYWQHRPGFNWLLGYYEGKAPAISEGIREVSLDRNVKDGKNLPK